MAVVACILVPLPPFMLDILLVINLILALSLLVLALYIPEPLRLSSLPSLLLLATLYRLALNICTTRLILSGGDAGLTVSAFGTFVIRGNVAVGLVIFLIITFVQFLVVAKGAERVAEVSARFSLDALPGRQMSIDADVRGGIYDFETARQKRQELQTESRFYGALDGAMKFIKGDAIAGIVIVGINSIGGLICGLLMEGLDVHSAVMKYSTLTIGDGLVSQIPSLLNSIAAGLVVTRVSRGDENSLAVEILSQLGQYRRVQIISGIVAVLTAFAPGMPFWPFLTIGLLLCTGSALAPRSRGSAETKSIVRFRPKVPPLLRLELDKGLVSRLPEPWEIERRLEDFRRRVFEMHGMLLLPPEFTPSNRDGNGFSIRCRVIVAVRTADVSEDDAAARVLAELESFTSRHLEELIDDISTRRLLDYFDSDFPELISSVVPSAVSVTRLTEILKKLAAEGVPFRNFDMVLQAAGESAQKAGGDRALLEEVRTALKRIICASVAGPESTTLPAYTLDPLLDMSFVRAETERTPIDLDFVDIIAAVLKKHTQNRPPVLVVSKKSRLLIKECLSLQGCSANVLAFEELVSDLKLEVIECIQLNNGEKDNELFRALAA